MASVQGNGEHDGWSARWITRSVGNHRDWSGYTAKVKITVEAGTASFLFGWRSERHYSGCELNVERRTVTLYTVRDGVRRKTVRAPVPGLSDLPAEIALMISPAAPTGVVLTINGREVLSAGDLSLGGGSMGFATGEGGRAVFRDWRVFAADGRAQYVNRFYDPGTLQFTEGKIDDSGSGLRLEEETLSLCLWPLPVDSPLFRRAFHLRVRPIRAYLRVYSIGWYDLSVNGRRLDNRVLTPANTPYERRLLYDVYDATDALQTGGNVIGIWLGNGYNMNYSRWGWKWKRDKAFILQLDIELADGTTERIVTDESWETAGSPIVENDIYDGETFDGRLLQPGWDTPGFRAEGWSRAVTVVPPEGRLEPNEQPPVRIQTPVEPVGVYRLENGIFVYDFGRNLAGWVRVEVKGPAGGRVTLRYSELAGDSGAIDPWTNRNAKAEDVYILRGGGSPEFYEPRFTYHGFRYVEVGGGIEPDRIAAVPIHADVRETGRFRCSDPLLNQIQDNILRSFLNNLVTIPTDCCQRDERTPCLMDSAVVEEMGIQNFDMRLYYRKWLGDIADSESNPDWSGDKVTLPWHLYWYYGDLQALEESYPPMKAYVEHLEAKWPGRIVTEGFGDWCAPNEDGWEHYFREVEIVNTALFFHHANIAAKTAEICGLRDDRERFLKLASEIRHAFRDRFAREKGVFGSGSQTAQLMPLALGLVPEAEQPEAVNRLVQAIEAKGRRLDTGIYGTRYLVDVLADHGEIDLAFELLTREDYPSFGWQIRQGATTLWEQWSFKGGMHSHDHAMFGGVGVSFYTRLAGISPLSPGYGGIRIRPHVPRKLEWAEASVNTVRGIVKSAWTKREGRLSLKVTIPEETTAVVEFPWRTDFSAMAGNGAERKAYQVGPGTHEFHL